MNGLLQSRLVNRWAMVLQGEYHLGVEDAALGLVF
jgi:hypothetical protein